MTRPFGKRSSAEAIPDMTRCRASAHARSGSPTMTNAGRLVSRTSASTSTRRDSRPTSACVMARASTHRRYGQTCDDLRAPCDQNVLEVLAGAASGPTVDVPAQAVLEHEAGTLEDLRIQLAAVVDDDQHGCAVSARHGGVGERG